MIVKEAKYEEVQITQRKVCSPAVYGCDECGAVIETWPNKDETLQLTVHYSDYREAEDFHLCSWECVLKYLPKIETDYFIDFPFLSFDCDDNKRSGKYLIELIQKHLIK